MSKRRKRHSGEQIVRKLREADAMLAAGQSIGQVCQTLEGSEPTYHRWRKQGGSAVISTEELSASSSEAAGCRFVRPHRISGVAGPEFAVRSRRHVSRRRRSGG